MIKSKINSFLKLVKTLPKRKSRYGIIKRSHQEAEEYIQYCIEKKRFRLTHRIDALREKKLSVEEKIEDLKDNVQLNLAKEKARDKLYDDK